MPAASMSSSTKAPNPENETGIIMVQSYYSKRGGKKDKTNINRIYQIIVSSIC
jgi:hypothetical protein